MTDPGYGEPSYKTILDQYPFWLVTSHQKSNTDPLQMYSIGDRWMAVSTIGPTPTLSTSPLDDDVCVVSVPVAPAPPRGAAAAAVPRAAT